MKSALVFIGILCLLAQANAIPVKKISQMNSQLPPMKVNKPGIDMCPLCVTFFDEALNQLLNIILNSGVVGSCATLCGQLPEQYEAVVCNLICDYVGITEFIKWIEYEDPDPIYICQMFDLCPVVNGGKVNITYAGVQPPAGPIGTTFVITLKYKVVQPTGPGYLIIDISPPDAEDLSDGEFVEGQTVGEYEVQFQLQAVPAENEPFSPGVYLVDLAICEGDCTTNHPYGGVYAETKTKFTIN